MSRERVRVAVEPPYDVVVGSGARDEVAELVGRWSRVAVVRDRRAAELHAAGVGGLAGAPTLDLEPGESAKSWRGLERVVDFLAGAGLDRASCVVTLGGGVTSDLGGLAASLFLRGIAVVHCPTTLLAQVDAAVGGKTAINLAAGKNLAGTFHQPAGVFADTAWLATLDEADYRSGLGEVVKTAIIAGEPMLTELEASAGRLAAREVEAFARIVAGCVRTKAAVVADDERESGGRKVLNLGHTFGHGIEHVAGYGRVPHGVAVGVGLALAAEAAARLGELEDEDLPGRVRSLLGSLGLPSTLAELRSTHPLPTNELVDSMHADKKVARGRTRLVLPRAPGRIRVDVEPGDAFLAELLAE